jgi:predicted transcriptional regulator
MANKEIEKNNAVWNEMRVSIRQDFLVTDLLKHPVKAQVYTALLIEGPAGHEELADEISSAGRTTVYNTLRELGEASQINVDKTTEPYQYNADPVRKEITNDDGDVAFTATPAFIAVISATEVRDDINAFYEQHGVETLATAYQATIEYLNGQLSRRMTADKIGVSTYAAIAITEEIEEVLREMDGYDPYLDDQLTVELND